jgi:serine/threonine protein kinase
MKKIGRYEIIEELGRGAMGVVYKASDPTIGRHVAIKVLSLGPSSEAGVPGARDIFMREARAAGRLSHPGIVTIHDALEDPESGSSYIVMEFVAGRTLESVLLTNPLMGIEKSLDIIRQIAEALDYAHQEKIVHRDLKPANILLTEDGRVKITDFGIAKIAAREGAVRTLAILGTPSYMSPEQVRGGELDARSDLFTMGILLFLMLTGQKPFSGDTAAAMFKVAYEDPLLPSRLNPGLLPAHDYLILRCLVKDPARRYASARDFLNDLQDVRQGLAPRSQAGFPSSELRVGDRTLMTRRPLAGLMEVRILPREGREKRRAFIAAVVLLVLLAILAVRGVRRQAPPIPGVAMQPAHTSAAVPSGQASRHEGERKTPAAKPPGERTPPPVAASQGTADSLSSAERRATQPPPSEPRAAPSTTNPPAAPPSLPARSIALRCRHELQEGTLTIASGGKLIVQVELKGKKRRGFIGIRGGFSGVLSRPVSIPADARQLVVRVRSADGSVDLARTVPDPPASGSDTLEVVATEKQLNVGWKAGKRPAP